MSPAEKAARTAARRRLDSLGRRRKRLRDAEEKLQEDTAKAMRETAGVVPVADAARRLGLNRSTVYEVYK
jgi:DNA invertase Pin-like site-specific DNA recombinase